MHALGLKVTLVPTKIRINGDFYHPLFVGEEGIIIKIHRGHDVPVHYRVDYKTMYRVRFSISDQGFNFQYVVPEDIKSTDSELKLKIYI